MNGSFITAREIQGEWALMLIPFLYGTLQPKNRTLEALLFKKRLRLVFIDKPYYIWIRTWRTQ